MEDTVKVSKGIEIAKEMVEKFGKSFAELESCREGSLPNKIKWTDIKEHFDYLEKSLKEKLNEVEEKERILEGKQSAAHKLVAEREAAVAAKELASLDRLQVLKYAAVSAIADARKNCMTPTPVIIDAKLSKDNKVSTSAIDDPTAPTAPEDNKSAGPASEAAASKIKLRPQLKELCERMDAKGLLKILSDNRKLPATISEELSNALKSAAEPARFVLNTLEDFYPPDPSNSQGANALQFLRRNCLVVMEAAASILGESDEHHPISPEVKKQAKAIADEWKAKLAGIDIDASNGYSLEAAAFLQLLATFRIAEEFHESELCKLVFAVSGRRQAPEICRSLQLAHRMPGVVETLVKTGRLIDAVHFAYAFQLTESFPPVPLLKEYLNNVKENIQEKAVDAAAEDGQKNANNKEMGTLKVIIKCIEEYKLQEVYAVEPLKKRLSQLEKAKYDRKRSAQPPPSTKSQAKKPRANGGFASRKPQMPPSHRYAYGPPPVYEMPSHAPYAHQPGAPLPYHYPDERVAPSHSSSVPYGTPNYGSYASTGYPSSTYAHQPGAPRPCHYPDERVASARGSSVTYGAPNYGSHASTGYPSSTSSYAGAGYQSSAPTHGAGYDASTPNSNYENYMGAGVQTAAPTNYGSYAATAPGTTRQSYM